MKKQLNAGITRLGSFLLGVLGFTATSCENENLDMYGTPSPDLVMYGSPTVHFQVKGKVVDADSKAALSGMRVLTQKASDYEAEKDTVYTASDGSFESGTISAVAVTTQKVIVEDPNGVYKSDTLTVNEMKETKVEEGDGGWYVGGYTYTPTENIPLKKK